MISESLLYSAANHASEGYTARLEAGYDPEVRHQFTPMFEKKTSACAGKPTTRF